MIGSLYIRQRRLKRNTRAFPMNTDVAAAIGKQAVVVGAGMAGLTAARTLANHFERVIVLDSDALPEDATHRIGTPQSKHVHALLPSGLQTLNELFPQFSD